jgi:hypothetical protein
VSGHVFHPGHEELHGVTVVVESRSGLTWVGRYHERNDRGFLLLDVATHDAAGAELPRPAWIDRLRKFGIRAEQKAITVPAGDVGRIVRLGEWKELG